MGRHPKHVLVLGSLLSLLLSFASAIHTFGENNSTIQLRARDSTYPFPAAGDGVCYTYVVQEGDTCESVASTRKITADDLVKYNTKTWRWAGCNPMALGSIVCLGPGEIPMPVALPQAVCGPQVPGTQRPANMDDLKSLNPCPSGDCCFANGHCDSKCSSGDSGAVAAVTTTTTEQTVTTTSQEQKISSTATKETTTTKKEEPKTMTTTTKEEEPKTTTTTTKKEEPKTTTTTSRKPVKTFSITAYEGKNCDPDNGNYFVVSGYSADWSPCIDVSSDLPPSDDDAQIWCQYYTNGGFSWSNCSANDLLHPKSWAMRAGGCATFRDRACKEPGGSVYPGTSRPCQDEHTGVLSDDTFGSLSCMSPMDMS
ncbi:hypothetical protein N7532_001536 [Penicillium argentinense]|uniref:LysM domain-containing protein n=1 Tax=Penicillium argentinense TaxID=1131581 RepID=A0A9W9KMJ0_9EURO|nr:uncharacterized protein N7532_001536 [Penicillium argentinense]KAJ5111001.1 hypothetical protein N7532_001536 [Penicillium argentinense]